jgi:hypothetical protein
MPDLSSLPLNNPRQFLMMSGIALTIACVFSLAYVTERYAILQGNLWDRFDTLDLKADQTPREEEHARAHAKVMAPIVDRHP